MTVSATETDISTVLPVLDQPATIETENVTTTHPVKDVENGYATFEGKLYKKEALQALKPDLFIEKNTDSNFGTRFPRYAKKGDMFTRVDVLPNRVYKFDGSRWIEVNKEQNTSYLLDEKYLHFLVQKIQSREIDIDELTEEERIRITEYLTNQ